MQVEFGSDDRETKLCDTRWDFHFYEQARLFANVTPRAERS